MMLEIITPEVLSTPGLLSTLRQSQGDDSRPCVDSTESLCMRYNYRSMVNHCYHDIKSIMVGCFYYFNFLLVLVPDFQHNKFNNLSKI